jgi:hypothetical protein
MAVKQCDSFDHFTTIANKWTNTYGTCAISGSYGRLGTAGLRISNGDGGVGKTIGGTAATIIVGQAVYFENVTDTHILLTLLDTTSIQVQVKQEGANFKVYRNATEIASAAHGMVASQWYYVEIKVTINDSTGIAIIKVDTVEKLNQTGLNTKETANAYADGVVIGGIGAGGASSYTYRDDVVIMDTSDSYCNDFIGDVIIQAISPTSPGTNAEWNPSSGANYACVDEIPPSTGDYVETATLNGLDTYATANVTPLTGTIFAVVVNLYAQKTGTADRKIKGVALDTGTPSLGLEVTLAAGYQMLQSPMYINARTSSAFTITDVNTAEFGVKLTT